VEAVATVGAPPQSVAGPGITVVLTIIVPTLNEREGKLMTRVSSPTIPGYPLPAANIKQITDDRARFGLAARYADDRNHRVALKDQNECSNVPKRATSR
jgi:hypothetical protein